jgi:hypothetical protein
MASRSASVLAGCAVLALLSPGHTPLGRLALLAIGVCTVVVPLLLASMVGLWGLARLQWRHGRVKTAIARRLRLAPHEVKVRVVWHPTRPWLPWLVWVTYPTALIQADPTGMLIQLFAVDFGLVMAPRWKPTADRVVLVHVEVPTGSDAPVPLEHSNAVVGGVHTTLEPLLAGLVVDQNESRVDEDGVPTRLVLRYGQTTKDIAPKFRSRVQAVIEAKVPSPTGAWTIRWLPERHTVLVVPCEPLPAKVVNQGLPRGQTDPLSLPLGRGSGGQLISWKPIKFPHMLVTGPTGGGKTGQMRTILINALLLGWRVWIIDPKRTSYQHFRDWPGVERLCTTAGAMREAILDHRMEMERVYAGLESGRMTHADIVPLLLIFDEVTEGFADIREWVEESFAELKEENETTTISREFKRAENALWGVARKGREAMALLALGLQRPDTSFIPGEARDNLITRSVAGYLKGDGLEMMFEDSSVRQRVTRRVLDSETGAEREEQIPGRGTIDAGHGPEPMQAIWTTDPAPGKHTEEEWLLLEQLREQVTDVQTARVRLGRLPAPSAGVPATDPKEEPAQVSTPVEPPHVSPLRPRPQAPARPATPQQGPPAGRTSVVATMVAARALVPGQRVELELDQGSFPVEILNVDEDGAEDCVTLDYLTLGENGGGAGACEMEAGQLLTLINPDEEV